MAASGTSFNNGISELSWTLGETVTNTFSQTSMLTQGFHQPDLLITSLSESPAALILDIYPNPTMDFLNLNLKNTTGIRSLELFAIDGQLVYSCRTLNSFEKVDMSEYQSGTYLLTVRDEHSAVNTFRIIKSN
jgi:hypothetical protein